MVIVSGYSLKFKKKKNSAYLKKRSQMMLFEPSDSVLSFQGAP